MMAAISFTMYITASAEWLMAIPLIAAGLLAFSGWMLIATEEKIQVPTARILDFTEQAVSREGSHDSLDERKTA